MTELRRTARALAAVISLVAVLRFVIDYVLQPAPPRFTSFRGRVYRKRGHHKATLAVTACPDSYLCPSWWLDQEKQWRHHSNELERSRLERFEMLNGGFLPQSKMDSLEQKTQLKDQKKLFELYHRYVRKMVPFDLWEPEYTCPLDVRVPNAVGDGPKWMCGPNLHAQPCRAISMGSNFDASFEEAIYSIGKCESYTIDPTLAPPHRLEAFRERIARDFKTTLNSTVGLGSGAGTPRTAPFPLVDMATLLRDRYGLGLGSVTQLHLSILKVDIEGFEWGLLEETFDMCERGVLRIDQLNVELHLKHGQMMADIYWFFESALKCNLWLHHKEPNVVGCQGHGCIEYSWVSADFARRVETAYRSVPQARPG